jgi:hypothetical protein
MDDVPQAATRNLQGDVAYPSAERYTLQWLWQLDLSVMTFIPQNNDVAFKKGNMKSTPSELLLHYHYGVAALTQWGVGIQALSEMVRPNIPRPTISSAPAEMRPVCALHDQAGSSAADAETLEDEEDTPIGADEVLLFFWGNTKVAIERRRQATDDQARRMEQWNSGGSYV